MSLLSRKRTVQIDLNTFSLADVVDKLTQENFFTEEQSFYLIEAVHPNHVVFGVDHNKITTKQIHEFEYLEEERTLSIRSRYKHLFFPGFLTYLMLLVPMFSNWEAFEAEDVKSFAWLFVGVTVFVLLGAYAGLHENAKNIERELVLRLNHLLRQKGYRVGL